MKSDEACPAPQSQKLQKKGCQYNEDWKIAECAASLRATGNLNDEQFRDLLFAAGKKTIKPKSTLYMAGYETGVHAGIVMGSMTMWQMDTQYRIPLNSHIYGDMSYLLVHPFFGETALIYTTAKHDVPVIAPEDWDIFSAEGHASQHVLYSSGRGVGGPLESNCERYGSNRAVRALDKRKHTSLLMPSDTWCPQTVGNSHTLVLAELQEVTINVGGSAAKTMGFKWALVRTNGKIHEIGEIPEGQRKFFQ